MQVRANALIALCSFSQNAVKKLFSNCDLFKRSFTNKGLGFTFNNDMKNTLYKHSDLSMNVFMVNVKNKVFNMSSAGSEHALKVLIENNMEEIERFERTIIPDNRVGVVGLKPISIPVSLHNPKEPANIRSKSFKIPLGHSTIVYITPKAREIDDSGKELSEVQRGCRLAEDTQNLDIFNIYSQEACLLECLFKEAYQRCGCFPWNYLITAKVDSIGYYWILYNKLNFRRKLIMNFAMFMEMYVLKILCLKVL